MDVPEPESESATPLALTMLFLIVAPELPVAALMSAADDHRARHKTFVQAHVVDAIVSLLRC